MCQALTQEKLNIRVLGGTRNVETPVNAAIFCTGNNLVLAGDLTRRSLLCALDARCERPELRRFAGNILDTARAKRGQLVAAALTVLRAWHMAGERMDVAPFGGFDDWSYRVREPLVWLGRADPCETVTKVRENDPRRSGLLTVLLQWQEAIGINVAHTMREVINIAVAHPDFHNALLAIAATRGGTIVSNERFGRWLKQNESKIISNLSITRSGNAHGYPLWQLVKV